MLEVNRTKIENDKFTLEALQNKDNFCCTEIQCFDCGNEDLNEFFREDAYKYKTELLAETYYLQPIEATMEEIFFPVAFVSFSNDTVNIKKTKNRKKFTDYIKRIIPGDKQIHQYFPAVKIGRLGVNNDYRRMGIGTAILNMTKEMFVTENRTGCRFLTVDAYKEKETLDFYQKNDFSFLKDVEENKETRPMYFDLLRHKIPL